MRRSGEKIKVLAYMDSPTCATGFGTVSRNILTGLYNTGRYDIDIFGINYWGDPHNYPFRIWPAATNQQKDPYNDEGFFSRMAFWRSQPKIIDYSGTFMTSLQSDGQDTRIYLLFGNGERCDVAGTEHILGIFMDRLG